MSARWTRLGRREAAVPLGLSLAAYLLAMVQRVGLDTSDTKIDLHVDPVRFLGQVAAVWSPTQGLGHVQGGQYPGYLWPMGPFFALGHLVGLSDWVTERLWLGTLLALSAWGAARLTRALRPGRHPIAELVAGAVYMANPYVIVIASRTTVTLLGYAALPWLLLVTHRGLRERHSWWAAAAFGLIIASTAGGVNAAVTAFVLLGPVLLALYEAMAGDGVGWRDVVRFGRRALVATIAASIWWIVPVLVQLGYGLNFLPYTEHLGSIGATTSLSESLRLMGYWPTYLGVGFAQRLVPWFGNATTMLFNRQVLVASLMVPGLALMGFVWTRRWRYGPLFLLIGLVGLLLVSGGWPRGTPSRVAAVFLYNHISATQFLRTTYKAGPLLAVGIAMLAGAAAQEGWGRLRPPGRSAASVGAAALIVFSALPMFTGRMLGLTWRSIPAAWTSAGHYLDTQLPANSRAIVLPGQAYAYYKWGGTIDPILPALTKRPVAVRNVPPYDDLHAVDLLWMVDDLVQQQRLLPGELPPLLDLMSARAVVTATDDYGAESGALGAVAAAGELAGQPGFATAARSWGPYRVFQAPVGTAETAMRLPEVRVYPARARGLVRVEPQTPATVIDGSAGGIADVAALRELSPSGPLFYAADESAAAIRRQARAGADIFITDSNRRRVFVASRVSDDYGWTVPAAEQLPAGSATLNPFPARGSDAQTVAVFEGARDVLSPYDASLDQSPEHPPVDLFDGNPNTWWGGARGELMTVQFGRPRAIPYLSLLPYQPTPFVRLVSVAVNGREFRVHPGWNLLPLGLRRVGALTIQLRALHATAGHVASGVGLSEARIPGVSIRELLRPSVLTEDALRGADLARASLSYVFEGDTSAAPLRQAPAPLARRIDLPAVRRWTIAGLANVSRNATDPAVDALAGTSTHGVTYTSSGRLNGLPQYRASAAFDGSAHTAWVAPFTPGQRPWIAWTTPRPTTIRRLVLIASSLPARFPSLVTVAAGGGRTPALAVGPGGVVLLPRRLRGRSFRLTVLRAGGSSQPVVALAELLGGGAPEAREPSPRTQIPGRCGELVAEIGARTVALRASGTVGTLDQGAPLTLTSCGRPFLLPAARLDLTIPAGNVLPVIVQLRSPAPEPVLSTDAGGVVVSSGEQGNGSYTHIRLRVTAPSWLVLGESYDRGWRASCNGRSLGAPRVIDAFANGWRVGPGCRSVSITFGPQSEVDFGYVIGGVASLALVLVLAVGLLRRRRRGEWAAAPADAAQDDARVDRRQPVVALAAGVVGGLVFGFLFGELTGILTGFAYALVLWLGVPTRALIAAAGVILVIALPFYYVVAPAVNQGGYDAGYALQHAAGHWMTAGAVALLVLALAVEIMAAHARAPGRH